LLELYDSLPANWFYVTIAAMNVQIKRLVTFLYGTAAIAVGVWRHIETGDSPQALWFGVVTGGLAILGGLLLTRNNRVPAYPLIAVSLCFVGGWFLRRMISGHSDGTSIRVILILCFCAVETVVLFIPSSGKK